MRRTESRHAAEDKVTSRVGRSPAEVRESGNCSWAAEDEKRIGAAVGCSCRSLEAVVVVDVVGGIAAGSIAAEETVSYGKDEKMGRDKPVEDSHLVDCTGVDHTEADHSFAAEGNHRAGHSRCYHYRNNRWRTC